MFTKLLVKIFSDSVRFNHSAVAAAYSPNVINLNVGPKNQYEVNSSKDDSSQLLENFRMELAKPEDTNRILSYMEKNYFCNNALSSSLYLCYRKLDDTMEFYIKELLSQGMTMLARENSYENGIMGICINQKSCKWDGDKLDALAKAAKNINTRKLLHIWGLLAREPSMHENLSQQTIFDLRLISVKKSAHSRGLAMELAKRSLCLGRDLNFNYARLDATDEFEKRIAKEFEMEKLWAVNYKNIVGDDGHTPVAIPERPNTNAGVYYLNLKTMDGKCSESGPKIC